MTAKTWMLMFFCMFTLVLQFVFICIVLNRSKRLKDTISIIDPIDDPIKEMNREKTDIE